MEKEFINVNKNVHKRLMKGHGIHLVKQPCLLLDKCYKTTVGNKISTIRKTYEHRIWWEKII